MKAVAALLSLAGLGLLLGALTAIVRRSNRPSPAVPNGPEVAPGLTVISRGAALQTLRAAFRAVLGRDAAPAELAMLAAHSDLETAGWTRMHAYNFGNVTAIGSQSWFKLPGNAHHFRAYPSAFEGASAMIALLTRHYPEAVALLGSGDFAAYSAALKAHGYFEEDPAGYARGLQSRYTV